MAEKNDPPVISYSQFACIGAGVSAIALGATLKRWYGIDDVRFFERHDKLGGTWHANTYPGCACDIPSTLYSFSFEPNPGWSRLLPSREEIWGYLDKVANKYDLVSRMTFEATVEKAVWIEETSRWRIAYRRVGSDEIFHHESQFLFAAAGLLINPREFDVPGAESFEGPVMHSAHWREDVDLTGKKVVLFGNGCTAAQMIPAIVERTAHLTQIVRTKHWILPSLDKEVGGLRQFLLTHVPGLTQLFRFAVFVAAEMDSTVLSVTERAAKYRAERQKLAERYMRETAPEKYHDLLIPDFVLGCKRRIYDAGYLASLHAENLTLTDAKAVEIVPRGVKTETGVIEADVIVLANGFVTNKPLENIEVRGRKGISLSEHWDEFGGPGAYNCSVASGFPNFFICLGPNSVTGHTSTIMASENAVNYALRIIKPILDGRATAADVKPEAEKRYVQSLQGALHKTVWYAGCVNWYLRAAPGRKAWNAMTYPWSQAHFWYRCLFPVWKDWEYSGPGRGRQASQATVWWIVGMVAAIGWALSATSEGGMAAGTPSLVRRIVSSPQAASTALASKLSSGGS